MKKLLTTALILLIALTGCFDNTKPIKKPFVIIDKKSYGDIERAGFTFIDANGIKYEFSDDRNKYSIGDTIK